MIDPAVLRDLGWSEPMIHEVLRTGDLISRGMPDLPALQSPGGPADSLTSGQIAFNSVNNETWNTIHYVDNNRGGHGPSA